MVRHEIDIQPPTDIYETFGRLNYKPWYAVAEFVDNSTANFFSFEEALSDAGPATLSINIKYTGGPQPGLVISDDAHGMGIEEFSRALRLTAVPPDTSGRSEFGMGLKTAACWFGARWTLDSTRLGDRVRYRVVMDLREFTRTHSNTVAVEESRAGAGEHGTTIDISPLRKPLYGRQIERIKRTLASMYRFDLLSGRVKILWDEEPLRYTVPELYAEELPDGSTRTYRQELDAVVEDPANDNKYRVRGWVGIRSTMSNQDSGFALFRRGRLIIGGPDAGWRPQALCGDVGQPEWKRLTGELHLNEFPVNFSKDGFAWDGGLEDAVIEALRPITREYRRKATSLRRADMPVSVGDLERANAENRAGLNSPELSRDLALADVPVHAESDPALDPLMRDELIAKAAGVDDLRVATPTGPIVAKIYLSDDDPRLEWITVSFAQPDEIDVILNTRHPFVAKHSQDDAGLTLLTKFALALALAEHRARMLGGDQVRPDDFRTFLDVFLRHATP
ncbi:MAG: ATP-binding protein [Acidimicrobiia bacterium]